MIKFFISASLCLPSSCVCYADDDVIILGLGLRSAPLPLPSRLLAGHVFVLAILSRPRSLGRAVTCFAVLLISLCSPPPVLTEAFHARAFSALGRAFVTFGSTACGFPSVSHYMRGLAFSASNPDELTSTPRSSRSPQSRSQSASDLRKAGRLVPNTLPCRLRPYLIC